jgi:hypothetical protein
MCPVPSAGRRRQGHPADSPPAGSDGEQYACAERRAILIFSSARSLLGAPGICRSLASGERRLSRQQALVAPSAIFFMYLGPHVGAQSLCACPPSAIKGEACNVTCIRNLTFASSYKLSSNTPHSGVGYYAPAARTTINPCMFLCIPTSLQQSSEKRLSPSSSQDSGRVHSATRLEIYSSAFGAPDRGLGIRFSLDFFPKHDGADRRAPRRDFGRFCSGGRSCFLHTTGSQSPGTSHSCRARRTTAHGSANIPDSIKGVSAGVVSS